MWNRLHRLWRQRLRGAGLAALVLAVGSLASLGTGVVFHRSDAEAAERLLKQQTETVQTAVTSELRRYVEALRMAAAAAGAQPELTSAGFAALTAPLFTMNLSGASGMGFLVPADTSQIGQVQSHWRERGLPQLQLRPAPTSAEHIFSIFQRTLQIQGAPPVPPGADVTQLPEATEALRYARATGEVAASSPYRLLRDRDLPVGQQQLSFALVIPVFAVAPDGRRGGFLGWLSMGMRGQDFIRTTLHDAAPGLLETTLLTRSGGQWQPVASGSPRTGQVDRRRQVLVTVANQRWLLRVGTNRSALTGGQMPLVDGLVIAGLLLTCLLALLVLLLATDRQRAGRQVVRATTDLRAAEARSRQQATLLGGVLDSISDGVTVVNDHGEFLVYNPAAEEIIGLPKIDGIENWQATYGVFKPDGVSPVPSEELPTVRALAGEAPDNVELIIRNGTHPEGVWISVSARPLELRAGQPGAVSVFHDITVRKEAETRLLASEERMRLLLDGARDHSIVMLDLECRVTSWSASAERIMGYTEVEMVGQSYSRFFSSDAIAAGEPQWIRAQALLHGRIAVDGERIRADGSRFWAQNVLTAITDEHGEPSGFVKVTRDMTSWHQAEAKFRDLLEAAPDAILGCDSTGRIVLVNSKVEELFGYPRAELLGEPVDRLVPDGGGELLADHRQRSLTGPTDRPLGSEKQMTGRRRDGTKFPAEISLSTLETSDGPIVSAAVRDIGDRIRIQHELRRLNDRLQNVNDDLERRVSLRTAELQEQTEVLRRANVELETFSYSVSHDLRSPLRAVDGFANVLSMDYADRLDERGREYLAKVRTGAQQMGQLIDGLLAFSRLQRQSITRQPVDLHGLLDMVWGELAIERADRDIRLDIGKLPMALGDPRLLRHVLSNLLGNAVKYTRSSKQARVEVGSDYDPIGDLVYFVRDNGVGFDMLYADKLFKVFQRLHRAEHYEGNGIGLALTARIVQRHGGRIWAQATPGQGATFFFTIPPTESTLPTEETDHESATDPGAAGGGQPERLGVGAARV